MKDLWDASQEPGATQKRKWQAVIYPELSGRPYSFFMKGKGDFTTTMTLFTDIDFTTEASADNNGVPTTFTTAEESVSKPVILPNLDTLANKGQIFVQVEFEYHSQTSEDEMKMQWLKNIFQF